ncbi:uncharacterized protein LOC143464427 [Clavelina lepadiformis]|uniref:uncharacterized protein LOC143464427 n=1 Tax=Clavelina lepadiformis TaxID=159417 RepID=UPI0040432699
MDIINIHNWNNQQVIQWFKGLDENIQRYESHLRVADVSGAQLLSLSHEDLHKLQIHLVGHQELILEAVALLQQLDYGLETETLQSRALCLKCRCRGLRSSIVTRRREAEEYEYDGGASLQRGAPNQLLHLAADVLDEGKQLVLWLDRAPFNTKKDFGSTRDKLVQLCYELSVTMQQSVFACVIEDAALNICTELENCADGIVQSNDSITVHPVSLEQISLEDINPNEGLGLFIKATFEGYHVVTGTRIGSVASKARKLTSGDEVVAVNGKAVVGWTLSSLVAVLKEKVTSVRLLIKKRPHIVSSVATNLLVQRNERPSQVFAPAPVKRINLPAQEKSSSQRRSSHSSNGTSSSNRSQKSFNNPPSETISSRNGSETNSIDSGSLHGKFQFSTKQEKREASQRSRRVLPAPSRHAAPDEPSSPIDLLKIPPPPNVPYSPMGEQPERNPRAASPNSMLDIEHRRRYTVIGDSNVDQIWYEDFLAQLNKCECATSSVGTSQDPISSTEEVFATPPKAYSSAFYRGKSGRIIQSRNVPGFRPMSMPPNYHTNLNIAQQTRNTSTPRGLHGYRDNRSGKFQYQSQRLLLSNQARDHQNLPNSRYNPRFGRHNSNNHNNVSNKSLDHLSSGRNSPQSTSSNRSKNPPKPPPRTSSVTKLSRNSLDLSRTNHLDNSPQSKSVSSTLDSKPDLDSSYAGNPLEGGTGESGSLSLKSSRKKLAKRLRSSSTPHLITTLQISDQLSTGKQSENKSSPKHGRKVKLGSRSSLDHLFQKMSSLGSSSKKESCSLEEVNPPSSNQDTASKEKPVPKPRNKLKKNELDPEKRGRSSSQGSKNSRLLIPPVPANRRRSADPVPQKNKIDHILESLRNDSHEGSDGSIEVPWRRSPGNTPPTARISYNAAIDYKYQDYGDVLFPDDIPQPSDSYELKIIAGVPVRLRKSLSRLGAAAQSKGSPERSRTALNPSVTAEMKAQRRVSCRDLGHGDCEGWLWKKKSGVNTSGPGPLSQKWAKRWVIIKNGAVYCYRSNSDDDEQRAECYISLPGYQIAPAPECKRRLAFRISHPKRKTFFFAAERQMDMSRWMNKMGLASIEYKFEEDKTDGKTKADEDYYSESDNDTKESSDDSPAKQASNEALDEKVDDFRASVHSSTMDSSTFSLSNGNMRDRSKSESIKRIDEDAEASVSSTEERNKLLALPPSPSRRKPIVTSEQRRHRGKKGVERTLSRSLESLPGSHLNDNSSKRQKSQEMAAKKAEVMRMRRISSSFPDPAENRSPSVQSLSSLSSPKNTFGTRNSAPNIFRVQSSEELNKSIAYDRTSPSHSSSPSLLSPTRASWAQPGSNSRRDAAGRPKLSDGELPASPSSSHDPSNDALSTKQKADQLSQQLQQDPMDDLCKNIKHSEVDLRGVSRRVTLRRKMTILSRDPNINEKMLRRRALERELKAKELELAYFDKLTSRKEISKSELHDWINQHPSLVAEIGTIRRMSKRQRHRVPVANTMESSQMGSMNRLSTVTSEDGSRLSVASDHVNSQDKEVFSDDVTESANQNNSNNASGGQRPRSRALTDVDFNYKDLRKTSTAVASAPRPSASVPRRRKVVPNRSVVSRVKSATPYLETDL